MDEYTFVCYSCNKIERFICIHEYISIVEKHISHKTNLVVDIYGEDTGSKKCKRPKTKQYN